MKRNTALKLLNPVLGAVLFSQVLTGLGGEVLPRGVFEVVHEGGGILLGVLALLHLALNWNWVKATYSGRARAAAPG